MNSLTSPIFQKSIELFERSCASDLEKSGIENPFEKKASGIYKNKFIQISFLIFNNGRKSVLVEDIRKS